MESEIKLNKFNMEADGLHISDITPKFATTEKQTAGYAGKHSFQSRRSLIKTNNENNLSSSPHIHNSIYSGHILCILADMQGLRRNIPRRATGFQGSF